MNYISIKEKKKKTLRIYMIDHKNRFHFHPQNSYNNDSNN